MSGVMKNTMDWMYDKHVGGKVFGLMSTLGGVTNRTPLITCVLRCVGCMLAGSRAIGDWPCQRSL